MKRNFLRKRPPADSLGIRAWALESNGGMSVFVFVLFVWMCLLSGCSTGCHVLHSSLHEQAKTRLTIVHDVITACFALLCVTCLFLLTVNVAVKCDASPLYPCLKHTSTPDTDG